jgi:MFS family permease
MGDGEHPHLSGGLSVRIPCQNPSMGNPYKEIFQVRGTKGFASAAFVARMPVAMAPIGIVTMLSQLRDEYWLAGAVAATFTFANAIIAPQISRLVDKWGQSRLLIPTTAIAIVAFALMMMAADPKWPSWILFVSALLAALMPSISAMVRARWTELFRDRPGLNTAYAFESAADELVYVIGATLSVGLSVALFPEAGCSRPLFCWRSGQRLSSPSETPSLHDDTASTLRRPPPFCFARFS